MLSLWQSPEGLPWKPRSPEASVGLVSSPPFCPQDALPWSWENPQTCPALSHPIPMAIPPLLWVGSQQLRQPCRANLMGDILLSQSCGSSYPGTQTAIRQTNARDLASLLKQPWKQEVAGCAVVLVMEILSAWMCEDVAGDTHLLGRRYTFSG